MEMEADESSDSEKRKSDNFEADPLVEQTANGSMPSMKKANEKQFDLGTKSLVGEYTDLEDSSSTNLKGPTEEKRDEESQPIPLTFKEELAWEAFLINYLEGNTMQSPQEVAKQAWPKFMNFYKMDSPRVAPFDTGVVQAKHDRAFDTGTTALPDGYVKSPPRNRQSV